MNDDSPKLKNNALEITFVKKNGNSVLEQVKPLVVPGDQLAKSGGCVCGK